MQPKYFSQFYGISTEEEEDWFDPCMSLDTRLYIDPFLVFETDIPLFSDTQEKFFDFFSAAFELAHEAVHSKSAYKKLKGILKFPEVKELCLGECKQGTDGAGSGGGYSKGFADALVSLASAGYNGLDHFEEIEIFTLGIGKDRISDATANIIKTELIEYTQRICQKFDIPIVQHFVDNAEFNFRFKRWHPGQVYSLPMNPFFQKGERAIILVPKAFLCSSHAIGSDGFEDFVKANKNEELRADLNYELEKHFSKLGKSQIVYLANRHPQWIREYVNYIENEADIKPYDLESDINNLYRNEKKAYSFVLSHPLKLSASNDHEFAKFVEILIDQFKYFIEKNNGLKLLWDVPINASSKNDCHPRYEATARSLFENMVSGYCQTNNITISKELGRGTAVFRFSSEYEGHALIELRLARNSKFISSESEKLPNLINLYRTEYCYFPIICYTKKEVENVENAITEIEAINPNKRQLRLIAIDAVISQLNDLSTSRFSQMSADRFYTVEENLETLRKLIAGKERAKLLAPLEEHARIELGIEELRKQMRPFEEEYWKLLAARSNQVDIPESEAELVVAELVEQVGYLKSSGQYSDEVLQLLQKIYVEVSKPNTSAAAKLKGTLSSFPPFVGLSYEAEIDTESFISNHLPTFAQWYKSLVKRSR